MLIPTASELLFADDSSTKRLYWDRSFYESIDAQKQALAKSATLYVGNLAFSTRTAQVRAHFSQITRVKQIHMGLDRLKKTPCGFCFVQYHDRASALAAVANLSGSKLDHRVIRVELDAGFHAGRQYGRGRSGGQVRDDKLNTGRRGSQQQQQQYQAEPGMKRERDDTSSGAAAAVEGGGGVPETTQQEDASEGMEEQPRSKRQRLSTDEDDKKSW